ncbi:MAG: glycoside hydrolase family 57 protein [Thermoplasmata archaeon]
MTQVVLELHLHQPWRLGRFRYLDLGSGRSYFDHARNLEIFRTVADRSYRPTLDRLLGLLDESDEFRLSLSVTGTFLEQARDAAPDVVERLRALVGTGRVGLVAETYYHSLAFLLPPPELREEVELHRELLRQTFHRDPRTLRMTELAYSDSLARFAEARGFRAMLAEGWPAILHGNSPTYRYCAVTAPTLTLLMRHFPLSDDIAFRFSARDWSEYPLTSEKFAQWLASTPGDFIGLFMDFETFGEHQPAESGILEFLTHLPDAVRTHPGLSWATVDEAAQGPPRDTVASPTVVTWADEQRDLGAWLGNDLQKSAFEAAQKVGRLVRLTEDPDLWTDWRRLLTSDHFYYMYVGNNASDRRVHQYFSNYPNPFDAYANYMNALTDLRRRALAATGAPA